MLRITEPELLQLEERFPGIADAIQGFENAELPACPH
jgi:hypothetical protein